MKTEFEKMRAEMAADFKVQTEKNRIDSESEDTEK